VSKRATRRDDGGSGTELGEERAKTPQPIQLSRAGENLIPMRLVCTTSIYPCGLYDLRIKAMTFCIPIEQIEILRLATGKPQGSPPVLPP
jgi:hypothetical protein